MPRGRIRVLPMDGTTYSSHLWPALIYVYISIWKSIQHILLALMSGVARTLVAELEKRLFVKAVAVLRGHKQTGSLSISAGVTDPRLSASLQSFREDSQVALVPPAVFRCFSCDSSVS